MKLTLAKLKELLPLICTKETSFDPDKWTLQNPLWGQCAVVALLVNEKFGGSFKRAFLDDTPFSGSHYWNVLPDGTERDLTIEQFGGVELNLVGKSTRSDGKPINKEYLLKNADTKSRYQILVSNLRSIIKKTG